MGEDVTKDNETASPQESRETREELQDSLKIMQSSADRFISTFERAARRWEMIVYPGLMVLVLFWGLGFFIIFSLARDMRTMAENFQPQQVGSQLTSLAQNIENLTANIAQITQEMRMMNKSITAMSRKMDYLQRMDVLSAQMTEMNHTMRILNANMASMQWNFSVMNRNISRPMSIMNSFMPW